MVWQVYLGLKCDSLGCRSKDTGDEIRSRITTAQLMLWISLSKDLIEFRDRALTKAYERMRRYCGKTGSENCLLKHQCDWDNQPSQGYHFRLALSQRRSIHAFPGQPTRLALGELMEVLGPLSGLSGKIIAKSTDQRQVAKTPGLPT
jgi:hypothetical protein